VGPRFGGLRDFSDSFKANYGERVLLRPTEIEPEEVALLPRTGKRKVERSAVWLCLVIFPGQSCLPENLFSQRPVSSVISETSRSITRRGVTTAPRRTACRRASFCQARYGCRFMVASHLESFESTLSPHRGPSS
jgi:hypothetical protein